MGRRKKQPDEKYIKRSVYLLAEEHEWLKSKGERQISPIIRSLIHEKRKGEAA